MILVFGSINVDLVARVATIPRPGETVLSPGYAMLFGGKGANQAVAAARAGAGDGSVMMAARIGDDTFGRAALANLQKQGVGTDLVAHGPEPTGCAFIAVEASGENAITVASGANAALTADVVTASLGPSDLLLLQMEVPFGAALTVARRARDGGARVIWNFAPAPSDFAASDLVDLMAATDILVVNEHEALSASRILAHPQAEAEAAAAVLSRERRNTVVLTAGARGAVAFEPDGTRHAAPAASVEIADTTGAGDTFVGVLAAGLIEGRSLPQALARACLAGSLACRTAGAQPGMPDRATLDRHEAARDP